MNSANHRSVEIGVVTTMMITTTMIALVVGVGGGRATTTKKMMMTIGRSAGADRRPMRCADFRKIA
jgi:hypothetical protein